jgi:CheY-like chemotaxis protein
MGNCHNVKKNEVIEEIPKNITKTIKTIKIIKDDEKFLLLSQLAHDLNTPLTSIMLGVDLLTDMDMSTEDKMIIIDNMKTAYEFILMLSRKTIFYFNDGKIIPIYKSIEIQILLERCIKIMSQTTNIPIKLYINSTVPLYTSCDESWLWDIIINLLSNCKKFTVKGEINIKVDFIENYIIYSIIDTGVGITEERAQLLFEPFQTTNKSFGTGIGLYGCKIRAKNLNGTINYYPNIEGGSIFVVKIPHIACSNFSKEKDLINRATIHKAIYQNLNILIIDDDLVLLTLLKKMLLKYIENEENIITCNSVIFAKEALNQKNFHCIISDKIIGDENGLSFLKYLNTEKYNCYKCLLSGSIIDKENIYNLKDIIDFYEKPISKNILEGILLKTIEYYNLNNVLIIDDEKIICKIMSKMCETMGLNSECVYNGQEALDKIGVNNHNNFSIIFLDYSMPILDGFEFIKRLKLPKEKCPYIVLVTAHSSREAIITKNNLFSEKINEIYTKPLKLEQIVDIMNRATNYNLKKLV